MAGRTYVVRVSSGGVPWDGGRKFLLIRRMEEGLWGFPKGGVENSEALEAAAIREIEEETGLKGSIVCLIQSINYSFYKPESDINFNKTVYYFLVKMRKGEIRLERGFEDHRWCNYSDGMQLLHYENDRVVLRSARDAIRRLS